MAYLDWLGSALAGSDKEPTLIMDTVVGELGGNPEATLVTRGLKTSVTNAALLNGAASHVVELDDVHKASILHAAAPVIPAALAMCEKKGKTGRDLLAAIIAGYEVGIRIGEAVTPSHYKVWHTTGTCGTFGAAAAAAKAAGLNAGQCLNALGSAGTQAAGLWEFIEDGAMSKHLHPGKAAMNGVLSVLLAERGYTAATRIIEGKRGFCAATAPEYDLQKITGSLGENFKILENCYKVHSSCRHTHHVIDVIQDLRARYALEPAKVKKIKIKTYSVALNITENYAPNSVYSAKFSLPFCAALTLVYGRAGLAEFTDDNVHNREIRELMNKVELVVDPELESMYPGKWPAIVEIDLTGKETISGRTDYPKGDPENPVSEREIQDKFRLLAEPYLSKSRIEELLINISNMDKVSNLAEIIPG